MSLDGSKSASTWQRPLLLLFFFGCTLSAVATRRFTIRLIADGMVSFAFVPIFEIAALLVVRHLGRDRRRPSPAVAIDEFFRGNAPWFFWMTLVSAVFIFAPERLLGVVLRWSGPMLLVPLAWSCVGDLKYFARVMPRARGGAWRDLLMHRVLSWGAIVAYFFGIAIWYLSAPLVARWL